MQALFFVCNQRFAISELLRKLCGLLLHCSFQLSQMSVCSREFGLLIVDVCVVTILGFEVVQLCFESQLFSLLLFELTAQILQICEELSSLA